MADGSVIIDALLNTDKFTSGVKNIKGQLDSIAKAAGKSGTDTAKQIGSAMTSAGGTMTKMVTLPLLGIGTASVHTAATFESSMSQVAATMGLTAEEMRNGEGGFKDLEKAAMDMGATTQFSASQAAQALNYLALAGYDSEKSIETLPVVLNLAAAGGMELATASDMVTDAMSALGLETSQAAQFTDEMAVTAQKSNTSVSQLGEAILTVGGTAKMLKGGTVELNTELGILADNGIKGAEGGTALRNIILSLTAPTDQAKDALHELGVEVFDAQGNMRSLDDIFQDLSGTLATMNDSQRAEVLSTIFNKVDLKSANALLANCGGRFKELSGYISDSEGAAADMAATMNDNLNGKLTQLSSAIEGAGIVIGNALIPVIGSLTEFINNLVTGFNNLDPSMQTAIVVAGGVVAAIGPLLMVIGMIISAVATIGPVVGGAGAAFMAFATGPVGIIIAAITAVIGVVMALYKNSETFRNFVNGLPGFFGGVLATIQGAFQTAEATINGVFDGISNAASGAVSFIQGLFSDPFGTLRSAVVNIVSWVASNFKLPEIKFPHIKLPHFSVSGELSINPPSVPHLSVDWYAKGGIFNGASIIGVGEAGPEAVVPLSGANMEPFARAIAEHMDSNSDATEAIYSLMDALPQIIGMSVPDRLRINEREFGRLVRSV